MGRSAKFAKRPSKQEKEAKKTSSAAAKPMPKPAPKQRESQPEPSGGKKRKMMRNKVEKVSNAMVELDGFHSVRMRQLT
jgi:hypothetical protein